MELKGKEEGGRKYGGRWMWSGKRQKIWRDLEDDGVDEVSQRQKVPEEITEMEKGTGM